MDGADTALQQVGQRVHAPARTVRASRARVVLASDTARRRLERDLHDGAQQSLVAAAVTARQVRARPALDAGTAVLVDRLLNHLDRALTELRELAAGIYPATLTDHGIEAALQASVAHGPLTVRIRQTGRRRYPPPVEATAYFCCREAIQNAVKHAGPDATVEVRLVDRGDELSCTVSDDGIGFDVENPQASRDGHGLTNLVDRAAAAGGRLTIESSPGHGTVVRIALPLR